MSVINTLVTDRTQADVDRLRELKRKALQNGGIDALTAEEQAEYFDNPKGAYNYTDLNRVGQAIVYIYDIYQDAGVAVDGYVEPKTDWTVSDIPERAQMDAIIRDVTTFRTIARSSQMLPNSMDNLNYDKANQIESLLVQVSEKAERLIADFIYSGEFESGENIF